MPPPRPHSGGRRQPQQARDERAALKGQHVRVPGDVFYHPGRYFLGVILGPDTSHKGCVDVRMDRDAELNHTRFYFPLADVRGWLISNEQAATERGLALLRQQREAAAAEAAAAWRRRQEEEEEEAETEGEQEQSGDEIRNLAALPGAADTGVAPSTSAAATLPNATRMPASSSAPGAVAGLSGGAVAKPTRGRPPSRQQQHLSKAGQQQRHDRNRSAAAATSDLIRQTVDVPGW